MKKETWKKLGVVGIFGAAMAFIETLIVVYLRMLYYPEGFKFPLNPYIEPWVYSVEWFREFFTIVMLACIAVLAARKFSERFAYFMYSFAVWDIFYYIWLKVILDWPASFLIWDLLFLIPIPWLGPVIAPLTCSVMMIVFAYIILDFADKGKNTEIHKNEWILLIIGSLILLYTWLIDYARLIISNGFLGDFFNLLTNSEFQRIVENFVPVSYNWIMFFIGILVIIIAIVIYYRRVS
ncbi:hypothetical protein GF386_04125 [Candidatus Pacearchaeota archaeon]|nr:hypothetical protein [Candidatus Pacearchaeota archaeon]MBD3283315.1 hypothetical protein [Candidatus Pacearchaeota archaeon]